MKQFIEFIPLIAFFIAYKLGEIFFATQVLMLTTLLTMIVLLLIQKKLEKLQWVSFIGVFLFGSSTLLFQEESILKLKAPIINWIFGLSFLLSPLFLKKPLAQKMLETAFSLPPKKWTSLNLTWSLFFLIVGFANLFVAFYHPAIWVEFKVMGSLGLTFIFLLAQFIYLYPYLNPEIKAK